MAYDGALKFDTKVDQAGFVSGIANIKSIALSAISVIGSAFAAGAIVQGMAQVGKEGIELASSLSEVQNVIDVTFEDGAQSVNDFAKSAKNAFGLSELAAKKYTGTLGAMLKSMGLTLDAVGEMSTAMTGLAGDFASFYNISTDEAFQKIRAGIAGETEPLRQLGINMSVANLEAYALAQGIDTAYASMTQAEQATLRFNYLMSVSADAQGDFARTSDSYANSQRLAALATDELKTAIGNRLIPVAKQFQQEFAKIAGAAEEAINERGLAGFIDVITDRFPVATAAAAGLTAAFASLLIIKGVTAVMVAFQTAQVSLALGMMGTTAAALLQTGALTANEIIVGALTGKIKLAAAAQALWNTVMLANPVGLLVTAIGLLVGGLVLINKNFDKINPQMAEYTSTTKQAAQQTKQLNSNMSESADNYAQTLDGIERQNAAAQGLIDTLYQMSAAYQGSGIEQQKMQSIIDELNGLYAGLDLAYDSNTGKINQNRAAVESLVAAKQEEARATADIERSVALIEEESDAKYNLYVAQTNYNNLAATGASKNSAAMRFAAKAVREAQTAYDDASAAVQTHNDYLDENGVKINASAESLNALTEAERALEEETERIVIGGYDVTDVLDDIGMTADEVSARLDSFTSAATNMFERISTESKIKVTDMIANLEANAIAIEDWGDNIAYLGSRLPSDLLQPLIDAGPAEMAGVLNQLAGASDTELANLSEAFSNGGEEAKEAWLLSLGAGLEEENPLLGVLDGATEAATDAGAQFSQALVTSINSQNYSGATSSLTNAFSNSFKTMGTMFSAFLERVHFDLGYAIGGVRIDLAYLAYEVRNALSKIPTNITIHVNVVYSSSGGVGGSTGATGVAATKPLIGSGGVYAPITVQGVVQSDTQLANTITRNFGEVMYDRNS